MDEDEVRALLRQQIGSGTISDWCRRERLARTPVASFLNNSRPAQPALLAALGLGWEMVDAEGKIVDEDRVRRNLERQIGSLPVLRWSREAGVPRSAVKDVLEGSRRPTTELVSALGLTWQIVELSAIRQRIARDNGGERRPYARSLKKAFA